MIARVLSASSLAVALLAGPAAADHHAGAPVWVVDASHTRVTFDVTHLGFSTMPGIFREFDVDFRFDPDAPEKSSLDVTIQADSIDMFNEDLNEHLRTDDFFHVDEYPTLTFVSTEVVPMGEDRARVTGEMTILGETHPLSFDVTLNKVGPHPFRPEQTVAGFDATGTIDRTEYGMDYAAPAVGTAIEFTLTGEFSPAD